MPLAVTAAEAAIKEAARLATEAKAADVAKAAKGARVSTEESSDHTAEAAAAAALKSEEELAAAHKAKEKAAADKAALDTAPGRKSEGEEEAAEKAAAEKAAAAEKVAAEKAAAAVKAVEEREAMEEEAAKAIAKANTLAENLTEKAENLKQLKLKDEVHRFRPCRPHLSLSTAFTAPVCRRHSTAAKALRRQSTPPTNPVPCLPCAVWEIAAPHCRDATR